MITEYRKYLNHNDYYILILQVEIHTGLYEVSFVNTAEYRQDRKARFNLKTIYLQ